MTTTAILSPHLDDAVLSCWHILSGPRDVVVANVFTATPTAGTPTPPWDLLTGARDPVTRMKERAAEDRRALGLVGVRSLSLGLLDAQYRRREPSSAQVAERLAERLPTDGAILAPAGLSGHPDHVIVRDAALLLARCGRAVALYADLPHGIARGWPAWVTGSADSGAEGVAAGWDAVLTAAGLRVSRLVPYVRPLDAAARARKLRVLAEYATQRAALDGMAFVPLAHPRALAFEVGWRVPASALGAAHEARGEVGVADPGREPLHDRG